MRHTKLDGLMTPAERIARVAASAYDAATAPATAPSGTIAVSNADGTKTIIGPQAGAGEEAPGGQAIATHVGDTTPPPVPSGIKAWSGDGCLHVSWDGTLSGGIPADFDHISILVDGREVAQLSSAGSVTVGGMEAGATVSVTATAEDDACLADGTPAHNVSAPCAAVVVEIRDVAEEVRAKADAHEGQIEAIQSDIEAYKKSATATYATKTEVDDKTGAITKTLSADYTKTADLASTQAVKDAKKAGADAQSGLSSYRTSNDKAVADAKKAGTDAQSQLSNYRTSVQETYAEKTELAEAVNQLRSTMTSNYSAFTDYRASNDTAVSKALNEIESVKTTYVTKSELSATDKELSGKISDTLTSARSYIDASLEQEVTARNAAIKAQADGISLDVSRTYTRSETFSSYQTDADSRIATASSNASTAKSTAQTAASDAATAKTDATAAQTMATENRSNIKQLSDKVTATVSEQMKWNDSQSSRTSSLEQTAAGFSASLDSMSSTDASIHQWMSFGQGTDGKPTLTIGTSGSDIVSKQTNSGLSYQTRGGTELMALDAASQSSTMPHMHADDVSMGNWQLRPTQGGTHFTLMYIGG